MSQFEAKDGYAKPADRLDKLNEIFERIEQWTMTKTKFEVMDVCNPLDIPVGPFIDEEIAEDEGFTLLALWLSRSSGTR